MAKVRLVEGEKLAVGVIVDEGMTITDKIKIDIRPGGICYVTWRGWGMTRAELSHYVADKIEEHFAPAPSDWYWRATNNKNEIKLIKTGELRPSLNHADNTREKGLSVTDHLGYVAMAGYKYGYRVRGEVIGTGSDGEPILDITTLEPLDKTPQTVAKIEAKYGEQWRKQLRTNLAEAGWKHEHYRKAIMSVNLKPKEEYEREYIEEGE